MNGLEAYGRAQILLVQEQHRLGKALVAFLSTHLRRRFAAEDRKVKAAAGR